MTISANIPTAKETANIAKVCADDLLVVGELYLSGMEVMIVSVEAICESAMFELDFGSMYGAFLVGIAMSALARHEDRLLTGATSLMEVL
jgi:hypothetical protein